MEEKLKALKTILAEVTDLSRANAALEWDQQVNMPPRGSESRAEIMATLKRLQHVRFTSEEVGLLLEELHPLSNQLPADSDDACLIKVISRIYQRETKVPTEWVEQFERTRALAFRVWAEARAEKDFNKFRPYLEKIVDMTREYAEFFAPYDHVYDPLLDRFEPGMKTADVQKIFAPLRIEQVALIKAISEKPQVEDRFLYQPYDERAQWNFSVKLISDIGFPWERSRLDRAVHPFTIALGHHDVRITTRVEPEFISSNLFSVLHEGGHALYDLGFSDSLDRTLLDDGASLGIHESQSRMWENLVGRSLPFWRRYYPELQRVFPAQLGNVGLEAFYKGINKVEPSLIRVEADEATYNLHVMLRLELEIGLMERSIAVKDLPEAWNERMQAYLGITPPDDSKGVLQDVHWSDGYIGYFPTYALGNLISAQLWEKINQDIPNLSEQIENGKFAELLNWLREKIHRHGSKYEPQELVERVTGSRIDSAAYLRYLKGKFGEIYHLQ